MESFKKNSPIFQMERLEMFKYREYLWSYFQMHAEQRLKTFNFYLVISAIFIGAFVNTVNKDQTFFILAILPLVFSFTSAVFWLLDRRCRQMIKNAEAAIKSIDTMIMGEPAEDNPINIFYYDEFVTAQNKAKMNFLKRHYSYSHCFNSIFLVFTLLGILASIGLLFEIL